ncbi:MAG: YceI family protein [Microthrixaceae bacterium]
MAKPGKKTWVGLGALGLALLVGGATKDSWDWIVSGDAETIDVAAPTMTDVDPDTERLFRITPGGDSSLTYTATELLAGKRQEAVGSTDVMAGDIAVNTDDPSASRIGEIVVNLETLESDSTLRDKRIRHDFLQSTEHPFATFRATEVNGLSTSSDSEAGELEITGDLTIRDISKPVTFTGAASLDGSTLTATAEGQVLMSDYGIGPIHVAGLAHTEDEVGFSLDLAAAEVEPGSDAKADLAVAPTSATAPEGNFAESVQPILEQRCATCHTEGESGWNTVKLDTAGDAAEIADDIKLVTSARFMPPWPASDLGLTFEHDYSMTDDEIATVAAWADDGGGLDVDADTKLEPAEAPFEEIERDQVIPSRKAYVGSLDKPDDYRCQVHEFVDEGEPGEWVTGINFEPDKLDVTHHSIIYKVPKEGREEVEALEGQDGRPGWECFGLSNLKTKGVRSIGGWAPGQQARVMPEGVGLFFEPGDFVVNQIHYHYDHETPADQSVLVFDTLTDDELAARETPMTHITGNTYLTPAEGPCTPEEEGPLCDRDAVLADIADKYGGIAPAIPDALIRGCDGKLEDYNQLDGTKFSSSCDLNARDFGTLYSVLGHMHEFGAAYRMTLNPDTPQEKILLDIPSWSFEWQLYYVPTEAVNIGAGDKIRFECTWDRRVGPMPEPRYITWNEGTVDEMCFSSVSVIPHTDSEGNPNAYATESGG